MASSVSTPPPTPSFTSSTSSTFLRSDCHHLLNEALHLPRTDPHLARWLFTPPDHPPPSDAPILSPAVFNLSHALLAEAHHPNCRHNLAHNATLGRPIPMHRPPPAAPARHTPDKHPPHPHPPHNFCMNRHQLFIPAQLFHHFILGYTLDSGAAHLFSLTAAPPPPHPFPVLGKLILDLSSGTLLSYSPSPPLSRACLKFSKGLATSARTCHSLLLPLLDYSPHHLPSDVLCVFTSVYHKRSGPIPFHPPPPPTPHPAPPPQRAHVTTAALPLHAPPHHPHPHAPPALLLDDLTAPAPFPLPPPPPHHHTTHAAAAAAAAPHRAWRKQNVQVLFDLRSMMRGGPAGGAEGAARRRHGPPNRRLHPPSAACGKGDAPFDVELMRECLQDLADALEGRFHCSRVRFAAMDPWTGHCVERVAAGLGVVIVAAGVKEESDMKSEAMMEYYKAVLAVETDRKLGGGARRREREEGEGEGEGGGGGGGGALSAG